jgi:hypothetical protein
VEVGGFDPRFRVAGDDVDICWRLRDRGWTLGFCPSAVVWHQRRSSIRAYLCQQRAYGRAEALLERKWPERYDVGGHVTWRGRLYGTRFERALARRRGRIYHGSWGSALFQSLYEPAPGVLASLPSMPEWYLVIATLAALSGLGFFWWPLFAALPLLGVAVGVLVARAAIGATSARFASVARRSRPRSMQLRVSTALLFLLQPLARLQGRYSSGLTPWRGRGSPGGLAPFPSTLLSWEEKPTCVDERLSAIEAQLRRFGAPVRRGGNFDGWDLEVRHGLGTARLRTLVEEHGAGRQLVRLGVYTKAPLVVVALGALFSLLAIGAALDDAWPAALLLATVSAALAVAAVRGAWGAIAALHQAIEHPYREPARQTATLRATGKLEA